MTEEKLVEEILEIASELDRGDITFAEAQIKAQTLVRIDRYEQLTLNVVVASLPSTKEIESRLKHVVDESFEDFEVVEKREYSLGFRACYNWLKIKQMKN
jgi:hypothetical protein